MRSTLARRRGTGKGDDVQLEPTYTNLKLTCPHGSSFVRVLTDVETISELIGPYLANLASITKLTGEEEVEEKEEDGGARKKHKENDGSSVATSAEPSPPPEMAAELRDAVRCVQNQIDPNQLMTPSAADYVLALLAPVMSGMAVALMAAAPPTTTLTDDSPFAAAVEAAVKTMAAGRHRRRRVTLCDGTRWQWASYSALVLHGSPSLHVGSPRCRGRAHAAGERDHASVRSASVLRGHARRRHQL